MKKIHQEYGLCLRDRRFIFSTVSALMLLALSMAATFFAVLYTIKSPGEPAADLILNHIRIFDVDALFIYGPIVFLAVIGIYLLWRAPNKIPFVLKSWALLFIIRSIFLVLTRMGPLLTHNVVDPLSVFRVLEFGGNDYFFSGHVAVPFLTALIFWDNKYLRFFSIFASIFLSVVVLLGHYHYSIDVLGAFFITYAIFHLAKKLFKKDHKIFLHGVGDRVQPEVL